jgi:6-pyruvoyl-tetrahydropterin synthase-like protein
VILLAVIAAILALPMLLRGPMPQAHDGFEHLTWCISFSQQFWAGELYPRWLLQINHGLGSPNFFVYGPLPCYVSALLEPLARILHVSAFSAAAYLALFGSGVCAFVWLDAMVGHKAAFLTAVLYMMMPYHLWADFYRRCALSECWALVWMPLILHFASEVIARKPRAAIGLALSYAFLVASHLFTVLIFSLLPIAVALVFSARGQRIRSASIVALSMMLGAGLAAIYLVPALFHQRFIPAARLIAPGYNNWEHGFLSPRSLLHFSIGSAIDFLRPISWIGLNMTLVIAICATATFRHAQPELNKKIRFWVSICALSLFFMLKLSKPLWRLLPTLQLIQYPWRFHALLCVAALPVIAILLAQLDWPPRGAQATALAIAAILFGSWFLTWPDIIKGYRYERPTPPSTNLIIDYDSLSPAWLPPNTDVASALLASQHAQVTFADGAGSAIVQLWKPRQIKFESTSPAGGWADVNQFYYPAWRAQSIELARPLPVLPRMPEALIRLWIPPGVQHIDLEIPIGRDEILGRWITLISLSICACIALRTKTWIRPAR